MAKRFLILCNIRNTRYLIHDHRDRLHAGDGFYDLILDDAFDDIIRAFVVGGILFDDFG